MHCQRLSDVPGVGASDDVTDISQSQFPDLSGEFFCVKPVQNVGICEMIVFCDPEYDSELVHPPRVQRVLLILDQPPRVGPVGCCGEDEGFQDFELLNILILILCLPRILIS